MLIHNLRCSVQLIKVGNLDKKSLKAQYMLIVNCILNIMTEIRSSAPLPKAMFAGAASLPIQYGGLMHFKRHMNSHYHYLRISMYNI